MCRDKRVGKKRVSKGKQSVQIYNSLGGIKTMNKCKRMYSTPGLNPNNKRAIFTLDSSFSFSLKIKYIFSPYHKDI